MDDETFKELLQDYFGSSSEITSHIKDCVPNIKDVLLNFLANIKCNTQCQCDVDDFIKLYSREANKTWKLKFKKENQGKVYIQGQEH